MSRYRVQDYHARRKNQVSRSSKSLMRCGNLMDGNPAPIINVVEKVKLSHETKSVLISDVGFKLFCDVTYFERITLLLNLMIIRHRSWFTVVKTCVTVDPCLFPQTTNTGIILSFARHDC